MASQDNSTHPALADIRKACSEIGIHLAAAGEVLKITSPDTAIINADGLRLADLVCAYAARLRGIGDGRSGAARKPYSPVHIADILSAAGLAHMTTAGPGCRCEADTRDDGPAPLPLSGLIRGGKPAGQNPDPAPEAEEDAELVRRLAEEDAKTDRLASEKAETIEALALKLDHFLMRVEKYEPADSLSEDEMRDRRLLRSAVSDAHRLSVTLKPRRPDPETDPVCRVRDALASSAPICEALASAADHARQAAHLSGQYGKSPITEGTIEWLWRLSADLSAHAEALDEYDMSRGRAE